MYKKLASELQLHAFEPDREDLGTYKKLSGSRLDWILISGDLEYKMYKVLPEVVSDHFAVYAELNYRKQPR